MRYINAYLCPHIIFSLWKHTHFMLVRLVCIALDDFSLYFLSFWGSTFFAFKAILFLSCHNHFYIKNAWLNLTFNIVSYLNYKFTFKLVYYFAYSYSLLTGTKIRISHKARKNPAKTHYLINGEVKASIFYFIKEVSFGLVGKYVLKSVSLLNLINFSRGYYIK